MAKASDEQLVRTTVLVPREVYEYLHKLAAEGERPLSWEIRRALEAHVKSKRDSVPV